MYRLENPHLSAEFDAQGQLTALSGSGRNVIDSPTGSSFRLVFRKGGNWENVVFSRDQEFSVIQTSGELRFHAEKLRCRDGAEVCIALTLIVALEEDALRFRAFLNNREEDTLITDFEYPCVGIIKTLGGGKPALLYPNQSGVRITNIGEYLSRQGPSRGNGNCTFGGTYPGFASMQWMALEDGGETLFLASYDADHYVTALKARGSASDRGAVTLLFDKMPFVREGENWEAPDALLQLYAGSWHRGADGYAAWSETWRPHHHVPDWVRNMTGYYLVIMKQQFGTEMWPYSSIPQLYKMARETGCDTVGLFGWYDSGHDNRYPDLEVSETLGGTEALRAGIRQVRAEGGNVTLYFQGHLIDVSTDFYKNGGDRLVSRSKDGVPYYEQYNKAHNSTYLRLYTRKTFATSCPCCPEWRELMEKKAEWVASFGPSGVLYDQIGGMPPTLCFDESHPHPKGKPSLSMSGGRKLLLDGIQRYTKELDPDFAFFTEHITDVYSAYVDALHGISSYPSSEGERGASSDEPALQNYPELFRYCFPDVIITLRNQRPYLEKRAVNYACTFGYRYELEVRYDADCEDVLANRFPEENLYGKKVTELRKRHWDLVGTGRFVDTLPLCQENLLLLAKAFQYQDRLAVVLWNDTAEDQPLTLKVPGWTAEETDSPEGPLAELPDQMKPQQLLIQTFRREGGK
ncbi:MAG: DUF6259 domain-containing protein [Candidatus Merdivicinus sp.]|jgi:hypothetical protein